MGHRRGSHIVKPGHQACQGPFGPGPSQVHTCRECAVLDDAAQFPRSCLMNTAISFFSTVPELSLSKVLKTSSKASSENSSPDPRLPRVSCTNFLVSCLSRAPDLSTS